jgi:hypothetical protein
LSKWPEKAIQLFPDMRSEIQVAESVGDLWSELSSALVYITDTWKISETSLLNSSLPSICTRTGARGQNPLPYEKQPSSDSMSPLG